MNDDPKLYEIEKEIDKMDMDELLYVRMAPQNYINKKFENELKSAEKLIREIDTNKNSAKRNDRLFTDTKNR